MGATAFASGPLSFTDRVSHFLERVDYRLAMSDEEREAIFRLRYDAYLREGAVSPDFSKRVSDRFDEKGNAWIFGVHVDGKLASSIRVHITLNESKEIPALQVFSDVLVPEIERGTVMVDPTRFVADHAIARSHPELPYITLRIPWLACEYFNADICLATVRSEHQAFYRRVFGQRPKCPARIYPGLMKPIALMMLDYRHARDQVNARYPFFRSTFFERRMLFERPAEAPRRAASAAA